MKNSFLLLGLVALTLPTITWADEDARSPQAKVEDQACVLQEAAPVLPLKINGRYIVDHEGRRFKLSGGSWYGAESTDFVLAGLQLEPLPAIVRHIRCMGFNSVRLLWSNEMYETDPIVSDYAVAANPQFRGKHAMQVFEAVVRETRSSRSSDHSGRSQQ